MSIYNNDIYNKQLQKIIDKLDVLYNQFQSINNQLKMGSVNINDENDEFSIQTDDFETTTNKTYSELNEIYSQTKEAIKSIIEVIEITVEYDFQKYIDLKYNTKTLTDEEKNNLNEIIKDHPNFEKLDNLYDISIGAGSPASEFYNFIKTCFLEQKNAPSIEIMEEIKQVLEKIKKIDIDYYLDGVNDDLPTYEQFCEIVKHQIKKENRKKSRLTKKPNLFKRIINHFQDKPSTSKKQTKKNEEKTKLENEIDKIIKENPVLSKIVVTLPIQSEIQQDLNKKYDDLICEYQSNKRTANNKMLNEYKSKIEFFIKVKPLYEKILEMKIEEEFIKNLGVLSAMMFQSIPSSEITKYQVNVIIELNKISIDRISDKLDNLINKIEHKVQNQPFLLTRFESDNILDLMKKYKEKLNLINKNINSKTNINEVENTYILFENLYKMFDDIEKKDNINIEYLISYSNQMETEIINNQELNIEQKYLLKNYFPYEILSEFTMFTHNPFDVLEIINSQDYSKYGILSKRLEQVIKNMEFYSQEIPKEIVDEKTGKINNLGSLMHFYEYYIYYIDIKNNLEQANNIVELSRCRGQEAYEAQAIIAKYQQKYEYIQNLTIKMDDICKDAVTEYTIESQIEKGFNEWLQIPEVEQYIVEIGKELEKILSTKSKDQLLTIDDLHESEIRVLKTIKKAPSNINAYLIFVTDISAEVLPEVATYVSNYQQSISSKKR